MKKNTAPVISHLRDNEYLLKGTPDHDTILNLVNEQAEPYIIIRVEDGNIRDLPGGILPFPSANGYLVFKKLYEVNKRPAIYLLHDIAKPLITMPKDSIKVKRDRVSIGNMEFTFEVDTEPVGYINLPSGKTILFRHYQKAAPEVTTTDAGNPPLSASETTPAVSAPNPVPAADTPNKVLAIINAIASDERNLTLLKDIAYTAFAIISKVKNSGAASKEEVAACVVAALTDADTRSRLRRIGSDVFRRFSELNIEAGSIVRINSGYRFISDDEIVLDEYPDDDMLVSISDNMKSEVIKVRINYDRSLGYPDTFIHCEGTDFGYISKNAPMMFKPTVDGYEVCCFQGQPYDDMRLVHAGVSNSVFAALIMAGQTVVEVTSLYTPDIFGCYAFAGERKLSLLCKGQNNIVAENMPACTDVCTVKNQYVSYVINALSDKVIRVINPHKDDTKALMLKGYKVGTENKNDTWILWGFPAGKTLNVQGLPKSIVGGVPQY